jgi:hypothetical protein
VKKFLKILEVTANIAIVFAVLVIAFLVLQRYQPTKGLPSVTGSASTISFRGLDPSRSEATLLLILSTSCHFCAESSPFYSQLTKASRSTGKLRIVAVLPQDIRTSSDYLESHDVHVDEIIQASPHEAQAEGTPTLTLISSGGLVLKNWTGKLRPDQEQEVRQAVSPFQ